MTDLRHVGELLHAAAMTEQMGATALTAWLRQRVLEATADNNDEERSRRLESDAEAVQVLTMHRSKGLEFPVVYYPDLWEPSWIPRDKTSPVTFHDAAGVRTIDVGLDGPQWKGHVAAARRRAARRGPAARLRRAHAREAPGGRVVGGLVRQPQLGAVAAAVRARRRGEHRVVAARPCRPTRSRRRCALPPEPAAASASSPRCSARRSPGPATSRATATLSASRSTAGSTGGGGARRSATSPPAPTSRTWRASRRRPSSTTSPAPHAPPVEDDGRTACARCPRCSPRWRPASSWDARAPRVRVARLRGGGS